MRKKYRKIFFWFYWLPKRIEMYGLKIALSQPLRSNGMDRKKIKRAALLRTQKTCRYCGTNKHLTLDHIFPISLGGNDNFNNLQILCKRCNYLKGNSI